MVNDLGVDPNEWFEDRPHNPLDDMPIANGSNKYAPPERLAELAKAKQVSMLFTATSPISGWRLNTLLSTTHIPFKQIPKDLSA